MSVPPADGDGRPTPPRSVSAVLHAIRALLSSLILVGVAINFANVVGRYVFLKPIIWAEEILVFIMVWCVMLGATLVTWENQHLRMDAVYHLTPPHARRWLNLLSTLAFLGAAVFVLIQSIRVVALVASTGQRSVVAEVPMSIPYGAIPLSFAVMVAMLLWRLRTLCGRDDAYSSEAVRGVGEERRSLPPTLNN
ncbi:MAG TPA: TRAP transporter small permease [Methylomirabilota bacterium]|nr:TRAP transporter small permease [Methylomirabilota bacterium]